MCVRGRVGVGGVSVGGEKSKRGGEECECEWVE